MPKSKALKSKRNVSKSKAKVVQSKSILTTPITRLPLIVKLSLIIATFFVIGSLYQVLAYGTGPLSFLANTSDINRISEEAGDNNVHTTTKKATATKAPISVSESKCNSKGPKWEWDGKDCVNINTDQVVTGTSATPIQILPKVDPKNSVSKFCKVNNVIYDLYQDIPVDNNGNCRKCAPSVDKYGLAKPASTISKCAVGNTYRFKCSLFRNPTNGLWSQSDRNGFSERSSKEIGQKVTGVVDGHQTDVVCTKNGWKDF